jgi:dihydrofolate synthase/folylpolyglutamate synthase
VPADTDFQLALAGEHQLENAVVALAALDTIKKQFPNLSLDAARQGLARVNWDGRLQTVFSAEDKPTLLVDSAHNEASAAKLARALTKDYSYEHLWLVFGSPEDKQIPQMMALLFPLAHHVIVAAADHPRATSPARLVEMAQKQGFAPIPASSPAEAVQMAFKRAAAGDLICACGSIIFIGDLLNQWDRLKSELTAN